MKGFDTNLRLLRPSSSLAPQFSDGFLPKRQGLTNLNFRTCYPRSFPPTMLKLFSSSASRVHHLTPAIRVGPSPVESPLFKALNQLTGWSPRSASFGHRVFFCSDGASDAESAAAETGAKAAESDSEGSDSKSSSAIVPTNPRPEDCLTVTEDGNINEREAGVLQDSWSMMRLPPASPFDNFLRAAGAGR